MPARRRLSRQCAGSDTIPKITTRPTRWRSCITRLLTAMGKIYASCGHELSDAEDGESVCLAGEDCDSDGFHRTVRCGHYCAACAAMYRLWPEYLATEAE